MNPIQLIFGNFVSGLGNVKIDVTTAILGVLGLFMILVAFDLIKEAVNDTVVDPWKNKVRESTFEADKQEYNWLAQNEEAASDPFDKAVAEARRQKLVNKWSK